MLYRGADGAPVAFVDRCVHRLALLSAGRLEGDRLRCMYHGLLFDTGGRCVEIPGQERIGPNLKLRGFPVVERHKLIWIWMGEAELADPALIPDAHWLDDPAWRAMPGYLYYDRANYVNVIDNLLDFSHLGYVHENTLGGGRVSAEVTPQVERFDWGLRISRLYRNTPLAPYLKNLATFTVRWIAGRSTTSRSAATSCRWTSARPRPAPARWRASRRQARWSSTPSRP